MTTDIDESREIERFSPEYRAAHLGASEWPAACGFSPFKAPIDAWASKVEGEAFAGNAATKLGQDMERGILVNARRRLGFDGDPLPQMTREHPDYAFLCATPDDEGTPDGSLIQAKMSGFFGRTNLDDWGEEGTDEVPEHVLVQVTGEMFNVRAHREAMRKRGADARPPPEVVHVAAMLPGRMVDGVCLYAVRWDPELAEMLYERVSKFWAHVIARTPPQMDASDAYSRHLGRRYPFIGAEKKWIDSTAITDAYALELREATRKAKDAKAAAAYARNRLCEVIGSAGAYGIKGAGWQAAWYHRKGEAEIHVEKVRAMMIDAAGPERTEQIIADAMDHTLNRARLLESLRALYPTKKAADAAIEAASTRGEGYRAFKPTFSGADDEDDNKEGTT